MKKLFEMDIKTKLFNIKDIWQNFGSDLQVKFNLSFKKPECVGMCILELSKVPICEFHCDSIKN